MARGSKLQDHIELESKDPEFAAAYLASALDEGDEVFLSEALVNIIKTHGATALFSDAGIARQAIYKMYSEPSFKNISKLLDAVDLELTIQPKKRVS